MGPLFLASILVLAGCATLKTQVEIKAPASAVREVLFDFGDYPKWNPFLTRVDGTVAEGSQIYVTVVPVGRAEINAPAVVLAMTPNRLEWKGSGLSKLGSGPVTPGHTRRAERQARSSSHRGAGSRQDPIPQQR